MEWRTYLSDCDEKLGFLDVGGTLVIAGKETGRNARRWGCLKKKVFKNAPFTRWEGIRKLTSTS